MKKENLAEERSVIDLTPYMGNLEVSQPIEMDPVKFLEMQMCHRSEIEIKAILHYILGYLSRDDKMILASILDVYFKLEIRKTNQGSGPCFYEKNICNFCSTESAGLQVFKDYQICKSCSEKQSSN